VIWHHDNDDDDDDGEDDDIIIHGHEYTGSGTIDNCLHTTTKTSVFVEQTYFQELTAG